MRYRKKRREKRVNKILPLPHMKRTHARQPVKSPAISDVRSNFQFHGDYMSPYVHGFHFSFSCMFAEYARLTPESVLFTLPRSPMLQSETLLAAVGINFIYLFLVIDTHDCIFYDIISLSANFAYIFLCFGMHIH